jgi:hypothetical protein
VSRCGGLLTVLNALVGTSQILGDIRHSSPLRDALFATRRCWVVRSDRWRWGGGPGCRSGEMLLLSLWRGEGVSEGGSLVVVSKSDNERVEGECNVDGSVAFET